MNKVALVTGSSRGIGRVIVDKLASNGYNVVIAAKTIYIADKVNILLCHFKPPSSSSLEVSLGKTGLHSIIVSCAVSGQT